LALCRAKFLTVLTEPRTRMISFRLTAEEYDRFRELCSTCGTRSVSELARAAINSMLNEPGGVHRDALEHRVAELEVRVNTLRSELRNLCNRGNGNQMFEKSTADLAEQVSS
jgi:hypothetical protein